MAITFEQESLTLRCGRITKVMWLGHMQYYQSLAVTR